MRKFLNQIVMYKRHDGIFLKEKKSHVTEAFFRVRDNQYYLKLYNGDIVRESEVLFLVFMRDLKLPTNR